MVSLRRSRTGCTTGSCVVPQREQALRAEMGLPSSQCVLLGVSVCSWCTLSPLPRTPLTHRKEGLGEAERKRGGYLENGGGVSARSLPSFLKIQEIVSWLLYQKCFFSTSQDFKVCECVWDEISGLLQNL